MLLIVCSNKANWWTEDKTFDACSLNLFCQVWDWALCPNQFEDSTSPIHPSPSPQWLVETFKRQIVAPSLVSNNRRQTIQLPNAVWTANLQWIYWSTGYISSPSSVWTLVQLTGISTHRSPLINNSPCGLSCSFLDVSLASLVLDQQLIPEITFFKIFITCVLVIVLIVL